MPAWWAIFSAESAAVHSPLIQARGTDYSDPVLNTVVPGTFLGTGAFLKAQRARSAITMGMNEVLEQVDVLLTPAVSMAALPLGGNG